MAPQPLSDQIQMTLPGPQGRSLFQLQLVSPASSPSSPPRHPISWPTILWTGGDNVLAPSASVPDPCLLNTLWSLEAQLSSYLRSFPWAPRQNWLFSSPCSHRALFSVSPATFVASGLWTVSGIQKVLNWSFWWISPNSFIVALTSSA